MSTVDPTEMAPAAARPVGHPGRLGRNTTVAVILAVTLVAGALGIVAAAALSSASEPGPRDDEARFLPVLEPGTLAADPEPESDVGDAGREISLGGAGGLTALGGITLERGGVRVPIPDGWGEAAGNGDTWTLLSDGDATWIWVRTATTDATLVQSDALLRAAFNETVFSDARVSQVAASGVAPLPAFGAVIERSMLSYSALYADPMLSARFRSNLYAGIRNDGTVLLMEVRLYSASDWDEAADRWYASVYERLWAAFGNAPLPTAGSP